MGLITKSVEAEKDLTVFTVVGEVTAEQILSQIISFLEEAPTHLVLWDFRAASLVNIPREALRMIAEKAKPLSHHRRGGRTVIVNSTDVDYGLSRMFQVFAELQEIPFDIIVSRNIEEAMAWLNVASNR